MNLAPVVWRVGDFEADDSQNEDDDLKKIHKEDNKIMILITRSL
jgi:hypothetical protein